MSLRSTIGYGVLGLGVVTLGFESTLAAQRQGTSQPETVGASVSITGCLIDERAYAAARSLASVPNDSANGPQLVLVPDSGTPRAPGDVPPQLVYALTGRNEASLRSKVGTRVEVTGVIEPGAPAIPPQANQQPPARPVNPNAPVGVMPGGSPAHEQGDAVAGASVLESTAGRTPDTAVAGVGDLTRLNVRSSRSRAGSCPQPVVATAPPKTSPAASRPAEAAAPREAAVTPVDVTGCVVRSTDTGDAFVLKDVSIQVPDQRASAVPGSSPAGSDSGTVPATSPTGTAGAKTTVEYRLVGPSDQISGHVGRRVRVTGTIDNPRSDLVPSRSETGVRGEVTGIDVAHPSAQELRVRTVNDAGGRCS